MDLKEIEAKIRAERPEFSDAIDSWPEQGKDLVWKSVCMAYQYGFTEGMTNGLQQHAKIMEFATGKILGKT